MSWHQFMFHGMEVEAKVYDTPSQYGIDGGRVSKMSVFDPHSEEFLLNYDRGWDVCELPNRDVAGILDAIDAKFPPPRD